MLTLRQLLHTNSVQYLKVIKGSNHKANIRIRQRKKDSSGHVKQGYIRERQIRCNRFKCILNIIVFEVL